MLDAAVAVANGKGGVGKTSLVANLAVIAANSGWSVLTVDLDRQGNLGSDLGYRQAGQSDEGRGLASAVLNGSHVAPAVLNVRPNLDCIPGGEATDDLQSIIERRKGTEAEAMLALSRALAGVADDYDLVLVDCPPAGGVMVELALAAARGLVIPVKFDGGSLDGLELMARQFQRVKGTAVNAQLELLGVVLFDFDTSATALRDEVRSELRRDLGDQVRVFDSAIRHVSRAGRDTRNRGITAVEYNQEAITDRRHRLEALRSGDRARLQELGAAPSAGAASLAEDYLHLAEEILVAFGARDVVEVAV